MRKSIFAGILLLGAALLFTPEDLVQAKEIPANGNIPLTAGYFPDEWFLKNVTRYDKNKDGFLSPEEVTAVTKLECGKDLTDFSQVQYFTNLRELTIWTESDTDGYDLWVGDDIDLTVFPNLEDARLLLDSRKAPAGASDIQVRVSGLEHLKRFQVRDKGSNGDGSYSGADAKIGTIDLRGTKELETVSVSDARGVIFDGGNQIKWISLGNITEVSNNLFNGFEKLEHLWIWSHTSEFTQFRAAGLDALTELTLVNKYLQTAEISGLGTLEEVIIQSDVLEGIDLSQSPGLKRLKLECPKLKAVDLAAVDTLESVTIQSDLLGQLNVEKNTALTSLSIDADWLKSLDVTKNTKLENLHVESGVLAKLNLKKNRKLKNLSVLCGKLGTLDISANIKLTWLCIDGTPLKSLNLSKQKELTQLYFRNNSKLANLDLSKNTEMYRLDIQNTALKSLDVSKLPKLKELKLTGNKKLTKLDLSKNKRLSWLVVNGSKKLTALDLSNNKKPHTIDVKNNGLKKLKLGKKLYLESLLCQKNSLKELDFTGVDTSGVREVVCDKGVKIKGYKGKVKRV